MKYLALTLAIAAPLACSRNSGSGSGEGSGSPSAALDAGSSREPAQTADRGSTDAEVAASEPEPTATLTLIDAGSRPRRKLRYAWRSDRREQLTIDLRVVGASQVEGTSRTPPPSPQSDVPLAPPVRIVVAIEPRDVDPDGALHYDWRVLSATADADAAAPSASDDGMRGDVASVAHLSGSGSVTSRGMSQGVTIDPASVVADGGGTGQMVEQVRQTLREVAAPFPEEEIGPGARWQRISELRAREARVTQTETFTLRDFDAGVGSLDDMLAQTASEPGTLPGAQARIESMLVSANARIRFDLTRLVPQTRFESTTTMVLSDRAPVGKPGSLTMVLRVEISLSGTVMPKQSPAPGQRTPNP